MTSVIDTTATEADRQVDDQAVQAVLSTEQVRPAPPLDPSLTTTNTGAELVHAGQGMPARPTAALSPGAPGTDEFKSLAAQAYMLHLSGAAPKPIRDNPYVAFHVAMVGRDLGISPSAACELIDVMPTRDGYQLSLSPELLNGLLLSKGLGRLVPLENDDRHCVVRAYGPDGEPLPGMDTEFTWENAKTAGLVAPDCEPGNHSAKCRNRSSASYERCNQGYVTYPKRMMWQRACGYAAHTYFPQVTLGLYSPEELGAVTDENGRPIDPTKVELPPGYETPEPAALPKGERPADPDDLWAFQARIHALPPEQQQSYRRRKAENIGQGVPTTAFTAQQLRGAKAVVAGLEAEARKADKDWDAKLAAQGVQVGAAGGVFAALCWPAGSSHAAAPETPPETPPGPPGGVTRPEAPEASSGEPGGPGRPTVEDVGRITEQVEQFVTGISVSEVDEELGAGNRGGSVAARRKRLVAQLVQKAIREWGQS